MKPPRELASIAALLASFSCFAQVTSVLPGFSLPTAESEYDRTLLADVRRVGWHHVHVQAEGGEPPFAYSLGYYANFRQPEVIVFGLPARAAQQFLNIVAIRFAGERRPYETFKPYEDIAQGMRIAFIPVARRHYPTYFGYAGWFYRSVEADFPALQMVWPDKQGRLPWEEGHDKSFAKYQPLLDK